MWPRTYGLRDSFRLFLSCRPSLEVAGAPEECCASILSIDVWNCRSCARGVIRRVAVRWTGARRVGTVAVVGRVEEQGPLSLNRTGGIQREKFLGKISSAHYNGELRRPKGP